MLKLLIVIPAYNEAENIEMVIRELEETVPEYDYVVINDGSADRTAEICREKGFPLLDLPVNLGLTGAFQTGMRYACETGYDAAIQIDADGQHDPKYIPEIVRAMEEKEADLVIGSRFKTAKKPHTSHRADGREHADRILHQGDNREAADGPDQRDEAVRETGPEADGVRG